MYQIQCLECAAAASSDNSAPGQPRCRPAIYTGQTSRTGFERGEEHLDGLLKKNENNPLYKHVADKHQNAEVKFKMTVVKRHFSAFSRLIHEALRIENMSKLDVVVMNSRGEFQRNNLPRLRVVEDDKDDNELGLAGHVSNRAGPEGGGGGQCQSESQSETKTFTFQSDSCNAGKQSGGANVEVSS